MDNQTTNNTQTSANSTPNMDFTYPSATSPTPVPDPKAEDVAGANISSPTSTLNTGIDANIDGKQSGDPSFTPRVQGDHNLSSQGQPAQPVQVVQPVQQAQPVQAQPVQNTQNSSSQVQPVQSQQPQGSGLAGVQSVQPSLTTEGNLNQINQNLGQQVSSDVSASTPVANPIPSKNTQATQPRTMPVTPPNSNNSNNPEDKSPLEDLAKKLQSFKQSLFEEDKETVDPASPENMSSSDVKGKVSAKKKTETLQSTQIDPDVAAKVDSSVSDLDYKKAVAEEEKQKAQKDKEIQLSAKEKSSKKKKGKSDEVQMDDVKDVVKTDLQEKPVDLKSVDFNEAPGVKDSKVVLDQIPDAPTPTSLNEVAAPAVKNTTTEKKNLATPSNFKYTIHQLLDLVIERNASDLHITVGYPVAIRVDGKLVSVGDQKVSQELAKELIYGIIPDAKKELLEVNREVDLAYSHADAARFRINAYYQQQTLSAAFRLIPTKIRSIDELKLPQIFHQLVKLRQGLVLVTGPTGSGKSSTLAAILQEVNQTRSEHIITIEDPIEYILPRGKAMVDQRELHDDTHSWEIAMKSALRQDPDIILIGEMRDYETIAAAITLAETGHLVFATLHTNSASQTVDRIIDVFPQHQQAQVRSQLANVIETVIAQRLVPLDKGGRRAVSEIMIATPAVRNLIREAKAYQLDNVIRTSLDIGMLSMEHSLVKLVREGLINSEKAQEYSVKPEEVVRLLKG